MFELYGRQANVVDSNAAHVITVELLQKVIWVAMGSEQTEFLNEYKVLSC